MVLPNLFIPGAGKSATSSLHEYLGQHPQIFMSKTKEPHFFSTGLNFQDNFQERLQAYAQLFEEGKGHTYRGESSTGYMVFPRVAERITKIIPNPYFIFVLRNPIDRAYSHYWWLRGRGYETRPFEEAVIADMDDTPRPENRIKGVGGYRYYYAFGRYGAYLQTFLDTFGRERIYIITTEDLRNGLVQTLTGCFGFLGVESLEKINTTKMNETVVYQKAQLYGYLSTFGSETYFRNVLRKYIPINAYIKLINLRSAIANRIGKLMKSHKDYPPLSAEERAWLGSLYEKDVNILRNISGLQFEVWANDFPL